MKETYTPQSVDTSKINLPGSIMELVELLAQNSHDIWAQRRIQEGWTFGTSRDDVNKKHPCLVPYQQLPESEKEYDRDSVTATIKVIIALGYVIEKRKETFNDKKLHRFT
ncbi:MAG: Ryanodine receptor Ryr [Candidatus Fischerbacteria bacterium RBG_13_37_8]|uniref:Ryanodine receptor Ryr n=1 Tax=Candidatus Fischerbacteria bacterium RBG_13_37_8 TaxID=1817863 RepID=A0A1F5VK25_9BACT|nr:MAG: Ryanodine receptor Ryr [Candidatus Fischerbacteria bacterium RBG_13_37_8]